MKSVLIDTNLLVLLIIGYTEASQIGVHKRLRSYSEIDFVNLVNILDDYLIQVTLPNVLTETSNLVGSGESEWPRGASAALAEFTAAAEELYFQSKDVMKKDIYPRLGLTDAVMFELVERDITVLTDDYRLAGLLNSNGVSCLNLRNFYTI